VLDYLDQAFGHPIIALRPLKSCMLMGDTIVFVHDVKFCWPLSSIICENKFRNNISTNDVIFKKLGSCLCTMMKNYLGFTLFGIMLCSNQDVSIPHFSFKQKIHSVHGHFIKSRNLLSKIFGITNLHNEPTIITMFVHMVNI
jgi:hypothetical protein